MTRLATSLMLLALPATAIAQTQPVVITNVTIYPVSGPKIPKGTIVFQNGKITAVGAANVNVPAGARSIDGTGKIVTPGFIHSTSAIGLGVGVSLLEFADDEYTGVGGTDDAEQKGEIKAAHTIAESIDPSAIAIPVARLQGVTTALASPSGGIVAGQGTIIDLAGGTVEEMVVKVSVTQSLDISESAKEAAGGSRSAVLARVRQLFADALLLEKHPKEYQGNTLRTLSAPAEDLQALLPLLHGQQIAYVKANRAADIRNAIKLANEYKLRMVLRGGIEAWKVAPELAAAHVPVVIDPRNDIPSLDAPGARLDNAALLREAGVPVLVGGNDPGGQGGLRFATGAAIGNGLPWDDGLAGVTLNVARAFGIADRLGSLEPGKIANVVVWSGDPFETSTGAEHVFIRGHELPLVSRQTELRDRYRRLPPTY